MNHEGQPNHSMKQEEIKRNRKREVNKESEEYIFSCSKMIVSCLDGLHARHTLFDLNIARNQIVSIKLNINNS